MRYRLIPSPQGKSRRTSSGSSSTNMSIISRQDHLTPISLEKQFLMLLKSHDANYPPVLGKRATPYIQEHIDYDYSIELPPAKQPKISDHSSNDVVTEHDRQLLNRIKLDLQKHLRLEKTRTVNVTEETPLADSLHTAILLKLVEMGWTETYDETFAKYMVLSLVEGRTHCQISTELSEDFGHDDIRSQYFARWLFMMVDLLKAELNKKASEQTTLPPRTKRATTPPQFDITAFLPASNAFAAAHTSPKEDDEYSLPDCEAPAMTETSGEETDLESLAPSEHRKAGPEDNEGDSSYKSSNSPPQSLEQPNLFDPDQIEGTEQLLGEIVAPTEEELQRAAAYDDDTSLFIPLGAPYTDSYQSLSPTPHSHFGDIHEVVEHGLDVLTYEFVPRESTRSDFYAPSSLSDEPTPRSEELNTGDGVADGQAFIKEYSQSPWSAEYDRQFRQYMEGERDHLPFEAPNDYQFGSDDDEEYIPTSTQPAVHDVHPLSGYAMFMEARQNRAQHAVGDLTSHLLRPQHSPCVNARPSLSGRHTCTPGPRTTYRESPVFSRKRKTHDNEEHPIPSIPELPPNLIRERRRRLEREAARENFAIHQDTVPNYFVPWFRSPRFTTVNHGDIKENIQEGMNDRGLNQWFERHERRRNPMMRLVEGGLDAEETVDAAVEERPPRGGEWEQFFGGGTETLPR